MMKWMVKIGLGERVLDSSVSGYRWVAGSCWDDIKP